MSPVAALLSDGRRLHLQHGPIDLIIGADGDRHRAFDAARARFETVLSQIMADLPMLRRAGVADAASGRIGRDMQAAVAVYQDDFFITPMAAVAGAVADTVLAAMIESGDLARAYVNNGGDIAVHLAPGQRFRMAIAAHDGKLLGHIDIADTDPVRGIATSGRHGRSLSMGIADSVTALAPSAAAADSAATLIANAVDLPGHPAIRRVPAHLRDENSDLGDQPVVIGCAPLTPAETDAALRHGQSRADQFRAAGHIAGAGLFLNGQSRISGANFVNISVESPEHA